MNNRILISVVMAAIATYALILGTGWMNRVAGGAMLPEKNEERPPAKQTKTKQNADPPKNAQFEQEKREMKKATSSATNLSATSTGARAGVTSGSTPTSKMTVLLNEKQPSPRCYGQSGATPTLGSLAPEHPWDANPPPITPYTVVKRTCRAF